MKIEIILTLTLILLSCSGDLQKNDSISNQKIAEEKELKDTETYTPPEIDLEKHKEQMIYLSYWDQMSKEEFFYVSKKIEKEHALEVYSSRKKEWLIIKKIYIDGDSLRLSLEPTFDSNDRLTRIQIISKSYTENGIEIPLKENLYNKITNLYRKKYGKPEVEKTQIDIMDLESITFNWKTKDRWIKIHETRQPIKHPLPSERKIHLTSYLISYVGLSQINQTLERKDKQKKNERNRIEEI